jgi:hypothetical protein
MLVLQLLEAIRLELQTSRTLRLLQMQTPTCHATSGMMERRIVRLSKLQLEMLEVLSIY